MPVWCCGPYVSLLEHDHGIPWIGCMVPSISKVLVLDNVLFRIRVQKKCFFAKVKKKIAIAIAEPLPCLRKLQVETKGHFFMGVCRKRK